MKIAGALLLLAGVLGLLAGEFSHRVPATTVATASIGGVLNRMEGMDVPPVVGGVALAVGLGILLLGSRRPPRQRRVRFYRRPSARDPYFLRIWR